ncbi:MAG: DUF4185 domain-containing protein [Bryobacteraceae bacterium]|jgi:hypothetical protein
MKTAVAVLTLLAISRCVQAQTGPPPIPAIESVTPMGLVTQDSVVQGRDGTYSAQMGKNSFWLFNDTALKVYNASNENFFSNSLSWATDLDATNGITLNGNYVDASGYPTSFFPFLPWELQYNQEHAGSGSSCQVKPCGAEFAIWPGPLVPDPARNRALILYGEIWRSPTYSGWVSIGEGIAIWQNGKITRPVISPGTAYPTLMWQGSAVGFTSGWVVSGDTLYTYGNKGVFLAEDTQIASVPLASATTASAWTYYAGNSTWSSNAADAVTVFNGGAAGSSVFYDNFLGMYVAIYSGVFNSNLYYNVSYTPWGPWSAATQFYTGLPAYQNNADYAALAHPEFAQGNGQTQFVTYVQDTGFLAQDLQLLKVVFAPPTPE